jgi:hypothetical protein
MNFLPSRIVSRQRDGDVYIGWRSSPPRVSMANIRHEEFPEARSDDLAARETVPEAGR